MADQTEWLTVERIAQELGVHPETILSYPSIRLRGLCETTRDWPTVEQEELTSFVSAYFDPHPIRYIVTRSLRSYPDTAHTVRTRPEGPTPQVFLDFREVGKHLWGGGRTLQRATDGEH